MLLEHRMACVALLLLFNDVDVAEIHSSFAFNYLINLREIQNFVESLKEFGAKNQRLKSL